MLSVPQRRGKATTSPCVSSRVDPRSCAYPLPIQPLNPPSHFVISSPPHTHLIYIPSFSPLSPCMPPGRPALFPHLSPPPSSPPFTLHASRPSTPPLPPTPLPPRSCPLSAVCSMEHSRPRLPNGNRPPKGDISVSPPAVLEPSRSRDEAPPPLTLHDSRPPTHTQSVRLWPRNTKGKVQSEREDRPRRRIGAHSIKPPKGEDGEEGGGRGKGGG